jgi:cytochrome c-type biogenesis protein CcmF
MIAEIGHFALVLAFALALYQTVVPLYGAHRGDAALMSTAVPAALSQLALIAVAFAALTWLYVVSDFTVENVWANSHTAKPLIYKIAGVWGNHEGSMVLWVLILALFGAAVALFGSNLPLTLRSRVLGVQGSIGAAFLLFILASSNPFNRLDPALDEGGDGEGEGDRETDIAGIEERRVHGEGGILEDRIEAQPLDRGGIEALERV